MEDSFSLKGKTTRQTQNQFHYSQINYNISCVCLMAKEKSLLFFFALTHILIISQSLKDGNTLLFPFYFLLHAQLSLGCLLFLYAAPSWELYLTLCFLLRSSQAKIIFLSLGFMFYFPSPHREDSWTKAIKFFIALSIYKTLLLFPLGIRIHYLFNKESIPS